MKRASTTLLCVLCYAVLALSCSGSSGGGSAAPTISLFKDASGNTINSSGSAQVSADNASFSVAFSESMNGSTVTTTGNITLSCTAAGSIAIVTAADAATANGYTITPATLPAASDACTFTFFANIKSLSGVAMSAVVYKITIISVADAAKLKIAKAIAESGVQFVAVSMFASASAAYNDIDQRYVNSGGAVISGTDVGYSSSYMNTIGIGENSDLMTGKYTYALVGHGTGQVPVPVDYNMSDTQQTSNVNNMQLVSFAVGSDTYAPLVTTNDLTGTIPLSTITVDSIGTKGPHYSVDEASGSNVSSGDVTVMVIINSVDYTGTVSLAGATTSVFDVPTQTVTLVFTASSPATVSFDGNTYTCNPLTGTLTFPFSGGKVAFASGTETICQ